MKSEPKMKIFTAVSCAAMSFSHLSAATIASPASVVANSFGDFNGAFSISNTIDQSGLSGSFTSGATDFDAYISQAPTHTSNSNGNAWFSLGGNSPPGFIDYDLGLTAIVDRVVLWTIGGNNANTLEDFSVIGSTTPDFGTSTSLGSFTLSNATTSAQVFDVADSTARYIRIFATSNSGNALTGYGEFAVSATPIPEPSMSFTVSLAALFSLFQRRRRKD